MCWVQAAATGKKKGKKKGKLGGASKSQGGDLEGITFEPGSHKDSVLGESTQRTVATRHRLCLS